MKKIIFGFFLFFLIPEFLLAHYLGGEISWECMNGPSYAAAQQGNYRFQLILHMECCGFGGDTNFKTLPLETNIPIISTIFLQLKPNWPKEITPKCYSDSLSMGCSNKLGYLYNLGSTLEYIYTSDSAFPNGVNLIGSPPSSGWIFYYRSCCHNYATNLVNNGSMDFKLRAVMYPYNGQNAFPCFDNSPTFAETPRPLLLTKYPISYNPNAFDKDGDSIFVEWASPITYSGSNQYFSSGYSYSNPLPNLAQNSMNVPAVLNPETGEIAFRPITSGLFVTTTKISTFKNGIKTADIYRDVRFTLKDFDSTTHANIYFSNNAQQNEYVKNIAVGDSLELSISAEDTTQNPHLTFWASGSEFGTFMAGNPGEFLDSGCFSPPCASLSYAGTIEQPSLVNPNNAIFKWKTSSNHIPVGKNSATYYFYFYASNGSCPLPTISYAKLRVNVWQSIQSIERPIQDNDIILEQNIPNPCNESTEINFSIPLSGEVVFEIKNILGQTLLSSKAKYAMGKNSVPLNLSAISPGLYFYSISMLGKSQTKRMVIK